jgi:N-acetylmuramoyl-L-alanine amidase
MAKVFLGVGHGGSDPGAVRYIIEKDVNLTMALACRDYLEAHGVTVLMSRTKDENDSLNEEIRECNAFNPDLALDIHNNAGGGDGFEAWYHHGGGVGKTLAANIEAEIKAIGQNSRGIKTKKNSYGKDYYGFVRETKAPAVIVEGVFVDNAKDVEIVNTIDKQKAFGYAYARGILKTLGIAEKKPEPAKPVEPTSEVVYTVKSGDTLSGIAAKYNTTYQKLAAYNGISNPSLIYPGQKIKIPTTNTTNTTPAPTKTVDQLAREVIAGKWGNGNARKKALTNAGYDYSAVQKRVNELL